MLPSTVTVEDYVVVKVDIDSLGASGGPELAIVEAIAHLPELSQLAFRRHIDLDLAQDVRRGLNAKAYAARAYV